MTVSAYGDSLWHLSPHQPLTKQLSPVTHPHPWGSGFSAPKCLLISTCSPLNNSSPKCPLDCKEIQPVHSEGDQPWDFFGRNDAKAETPVVWPPHAKS